MLQENLCLDVVMKSQLCRDTNPVPDSNINNIKDRDKDMLSSDILCRCILHAPQCTVVLHSYNTERRYIYR
jgi:hypothetical protein